MPFILLPFDERGSHSYEWENITQWDLSALSEIRPSQKGFVSKREREWQRRDDTFHFFQSVESQIQMGIVGMENEGKPTQKNFLKVPRRALISGLQQPGLLPAIFGDRDRDYPDQHEFEWEVNGDDIHHFFRLGADRELYRELYARSSQRFWICQPLHFYCYTWWKRIKRSRVDFHERTVVLALMEEKVVYDKSGEWNAALRLRDEPDQQREMLSTITKDVWKKRYSFYKNRTAPSTRGLQRFWEFLYFDSDWNYTKANSSYNNSIYPGASEYFRDVLNKIDLTMPNEANGE